MKIKKLNENSRGFTLVEIIIAVGILSGISLALMKLTDTTFKMNKTAITTNEIIDVTAVIKGHLTNSRNCSETFLGRNPVDDKIQVDGFALKIEDINNPGSFLDKFPVGSGYGIAKSSVLTGYYWLEDQPPKADYLVANNYSRLILLFHRKGAYSPNTRKLIPMWVATDATGNITECRALLTSNDTLWQQSTDEISNIYFDGLGGDANLSKGIVSIGTNTDTGVTPGVTVHSHRRFGASFFGVSAENENAGVEFCSNLDVNGGGSGSRDNFFSGCAVSAWRFFSNSTGDLNLNSSASSWLSFSEWTSTLNVESKSIKVNSAGSEYTVVDSTGFAVVAQGTMTPIALSPGLNSGSLMNATGFGVGTGVNSSSGGGASSGGYTFMSKDGVVVSVEDAMVPTGSVMGSKSGTIMNATGFSVGSGSGSAEFGYTIMSKEGVAVSTEGTMTAGGLSSGINSGSIMNAGGFGVGAGVSSGGGGATSGGYAFLSKEGLIVTQSDSPPAVAGGSIPSGVSGVLVDMNSIAIGVAGDHGSMLEDNKLSIVTNTQGMHLSIDTLNAVGANLNLSSDANVVVNATGNITMNAGSTISYNVTSANFGTAEVKADRFTTNSDARLKNKIDNLDNEDIIEKILSLRPVEYHFIEQKVRPDKNSKRLGFIAQEMNEVFPELVLENKETHFFSIDYQGLISPIIKALQYILNKIMGPDPKVIKLEKELKLQKEKMLALELRLKKIEEITK